ncbi:MAG: hypothetical protein ABFS12_18650 [Bacteroidota bacterium]
MNVKKIYLALFVFIIFLSSCGDNPVGPTQVDNLLEMNGPTIIYSLVSESSIGNRIYNSETDKALFDDNSIRSNVRISSDKKSIAYVKNASLHPWSGYYTDGIPTVTISTDMGETEKELLNSDSLSAYFIDWIRNNKIAVSSVESGSPYLTIIDTNGEVLERKSTSNVYKMYMLPDGKHLVAYNYKEFGVLDVSTYDFQVYDPDAELSTWQTPFFTDSTFIFNSYDDEGYRLIEFDLSNNSFEKLSVKTPNVRLVYADATNWVYYNNLENKLNLFQNGSQISSVILSGYGCDVGLSLVNENEFYFIGESRTVDDEGIIVKVDFNKNNVTKLTNHGEDKFIVDSKFYNL